MACPRCGGNIQELFVSNEYGFACDTCMYPYPEEEEEETMPTIDNVTIEQLNLLKHMTGLSNTPDTAYRNHYAGQNDELDKLVVLELVRKREDPFISGGIVYHVINKGWDFMEQVLGEFTIEE